MRLRANSALRLKIAPALLLNQLDRRRLGRQNHHGVMLDPAQGELEDAPAQTEASDLRLTAPGERTLSSVLLEPCVGVSTQSGGAREK